jgi:rod shape-determining protein MreD
MFGSSDGLLIGLFAGLMRDLLAGRTLGLGMLILMYSGFFASLFLRRLFRRNILFGLVQIAFFTLVYEIIIVLLTFLVPLQPDVTYGLAFLARQAARGLLAQTGVNMLAGLPLIFLLAWLGPYRRSLRLDEEGKLAGDSIWHAM